MAKQKKNWKRLYSFWLGWICLILVASQMFFQPTFIYGSVQVTALSLATLILSILTISISKDKK
jgi:hypothetical protein